MRAYRVVLAAVVFAGAFQTLVRAESIYPGTKHESLVICTDPGMDDALFAELVSSAASQKKPHIAAVVAHYGCTSRENALRHARRGYGWAIDVPVIAGAKAPLSMPHPIYGTSLPTYYVPNGLCSSELPQVSREPISIQATGEMLRAVLENSSGTIKWVMLGPCTDLALFFTQYPELAKDRTSSLVLMAGAFSHGNSGEKFLAEFNVFLDVPAFVQVLEWADNNSIPVQVVPWDNAVLVWEDQLCCLEPEAGKARAALFKKIMQSYFAVYGSDRIPGDEEWTGVDKGDSFWRFTDPKVALLLLHPEMMESESIKLQVVTAGPAAHYGRTVLAQKAAELPKGCTLSCPYKVDLCHPRNTNLASRKLLQMLGLHYPQR